MAGKIGIIDYQMGNIGSIIKRLKGVDAIVLTDAKDFSKVDKYILPGVGHFGKAMDFLKNKAMIEPLNNEIIGNQKPILGICLGMQLFLENSEEGNVDGLGWIKGTVKHFNIIDTKTYKIPHTGWNTVEMVNSSPLFKNIEKEKFYFVHSYFVECANPENIIGQTDYSREFTSAVQKNNIFGTQFHPEKSHQQGQVLLNNFINL